MTAKKATPESDEVGQAPAEGWGDLVEVVAIKMFKHDGLQVFPGHRLRLTKQQAGELAPLTTPYTEIGGVYAPEGVDDGRIEDDNDED